MLPPALREAKPGIVGRPAALAMVLILPQCSQNAPPRIQLTNLLQVLAVVNPPSQWEAFFSALAFLSEMPI